MKNLKQSVINKGWVDIQNEFLGTITIHKNNFWFSIIIDNKMKNTKEIIIDIIFLIFAFGLLWFTMVTKWGF